jgi:hypothetical protein
MIGKKGLVTKDNFDDDIGVLRAIFPSGAVCEMDGVSDKGRFYTYLLKTNVRQGVFSNRFGQCLSNSMPVIRKGDTVSIEFDADDDSVTFNVEVAKIKF